MSIPDEVADYSETIPAAPGHYVYRLWAADGTCLYVGCCGERTPQRVSSRLRDHRRKKQWWPQVARIDVATFGTATGAVTEEPLQIRRLSPAHNKTLLRESVDGGWADWYARNPQALVRKRQRDRIRDRDRIRIRPSGGARAATARRKAGPGQMELP
jgi:hypothetical protein